MLLTGLLASAQVRTPDFLIDPSKDYVYLEFDHLGSRERIGGDEVSQGLWIRLVNNCRVPVVVAMFNPGADDPVQGSISPSPEYMIDVVAYFANSQRSPVITRVALSDSFDPSADARLG